MKKLTKAEKVEALANTVHDMDISDIVALAIQAQRDYYSKLSARELDKEYRDLVGTESQPSALKPPFG